MKFDQLRSIAHNIADSLASGAGLLIGVYEMDDVFGEAARSPEGYITVDFLHGTASGGTPSPSLSRAIALYRDGLAELCAKHGTSPTAFRELNARYWVDAVGLRIRVTVADQAGHRAVDDYVGSPGKRVRARDSLGRRRRVRRLR
jgi:hypothetical protein